MIKEHSGEKETAHYTMLQNEQSGKAIHVLSVGPFGHAVASYLQTSMTNVEVTPVNHHEVPLPQTWPAAHVNVLVSWRPVSGLCLLMEQVSFQWNRPFIPVIVESSSLSVGPVVIPGKGCCWTCWVRRSRQHAEWPEEQDLLLRYYADHPEAGPKGFLAPFAMMAAAQLAGTIEKLGHPDGIAGNIWQIDMLSRRITTSTVVGVHDCSKCGLQRPAKTRTTDGLRYDLGYLWSQAQVRAQ